MTFPRGSLALLGALLVGLACLGQARGQITSTLSPDDPDVAALDLRVQDFLKKISQDQTAEAFKDLLAGASWLEDAKERLAELSSRAAGLKGTYGECQAVERLEARKIGTRVVVLRYLYLCERYPVAWHFIFYRPPQRRDAVATSVPWQVISVRFDTDLERLLR